MKFLPEQDRQYLGDRGLAWDEIVEGIYKGIVFRSFPLPGGRFDVSVADILILLPTGYPDVPPDMFYLFPWVRLVPLSQYPKAADQPFQFQGQSWQRWSRHNAEWRPGTDGIWTMLKRIEYALELAA
jgi:hypothetical protein